MKERVDEKRVLRTTNQSCNTMFFAVMQTIQMSCCVALLDKSCIDSISVFCYGIKKI